MPFFDSLVDATRGSREALVQAPIIQDCLRGEVALPSYIRFLAEAYHHVRHTVPLMHACRTRMPGRLAWMDAALEELKPKTAAATETVARPPVVPVDAEIAGVDVMDMEAATQALWKEGIYAETAMGCTGPVVRVQKDAKDAAVEVLNKAGFL